MVGSSRDDYVIYTRLFVRTHETQICVYLLEDPFFLLEGFQKDITSLTLEQLGMGFGEDLVGLKHPLILIGQVMAILRDFHDFKRSEKPTI